MNEFERHWTSGMLSGSPTSFDSEPTPKQIARFAWRAALVWTLRTEKELSEQDTPIGMRDVIEKELGE